MMALTPLWLWLKQIQSDSNSFILTQLDDVSHLEFCHLGFNHFEQIKTSLIHCHSTWWWQPSWILPSWIQPFCTQKTSLIHWLTNSILMMAAILNSAMLDSATANLDSDHFYENLHSIDSDSLIQSWWWHPSWIYHLGFSHFAQNSDSLIQSDSPNLNLMMTAILNSAMLDSATAILDSKWHLVNFSQIHSKTLSLHSDSDSN